MMDQKCPLHSGIQTAQEELCRRCDEMNEQKEKQWTAIADIQAEVGKKASVSSIKWGVGIFIVIAMAVVTFMWNGQSKLADKTEANQAKIIEKIEKVENKDADERRNLIQTIDALKEVVIKLEGKIR
jgi:hypothetical protein